MSKLTQIKKKQSLSTSSLKSVAFAKKVASLVNTNNDKKQKDTQFRSDNMEPFLNTTPLSKVNFQMQSPQIKEVFSEYLNGKLSEPDLMYVRNFPRHYDRLPSPRLKYLPFVAQPDTEKSSLQQQQQQALSDSNESDYMDLGHEKIVTELVDHKLIKKIRYALKRESQLSPKNSNTINKVQEQNSSSVKKTVPSSTKNNDNKKFFDFSLTGAVGNKRQFHKKIDNYFKQLQNAIKSNIHARKTNEQSQQGVGKSKLFGQLGSIPKDYKKKRTNNNLENVDGNNYSQTSGFVTKALRNLSIIHEQKENKSTQSIVDLRLQLPQEYQLYRALYEKYFNENADSYVKAVREPYPPNYRNLIINSDLEYNKLLKSYLNKSKMNTTTPTQNTNGNNNNNNNKSINNNNNPQNTYNIDKPIEKNTQFYKEKFSKYVSIYNPKVYISSQMQMNARNKEKVFMKQLEDLDHFQKNHMIESLDRFDLNQEKPPEYKKEFPKKKILMTRSYLNNTTSNLQQQQKVEDTVTNNESIQQSEINQQMQKKIEQQKQNGFFVIRRNQGKDALESGEKDGLIRDDSDDSSNASMTEGTLEQLYGESIALQNRIMNKEDDGLIKKLKYMVKLEDLKKSVIEANAYKLEHR